MKLTDLINRLAYAIFRAEGRQTSNNPGNLRSAPWRKNVLIVGGFWKPTTREEGIAGAIHQIALDIARGLSLSELITKWAPPSDKNPTSAYIKSVKEWAQIPDENVPLWNYLVE